jgi:hypothetical protein
MAESKDEPRKPSPSPFERFVHAIANVPKREVDEIAEADKRRWSAKKNDKPA